MSILPYLKSLLRIIIGLAVGLPLVLYPYLYFVQEKLLFYPRELPPDTLEWARKQYPGAEQSLISQDGARLHGWLLKAESQPAPLLIYFGGNAEEISWLLPIGEELPGWNVLLMNYRGYGLSQGAPSQEALYRDALFLYDQFAAQPGIDKHRIVAMGRSLGSGVAVHLAANRPLAGVILVSPYDSIAAVAQDFYPYVPVRWLLRHPFDVLPLAGGIRAPLLALTAERDTLISPLRSERLISAWGGPERQIVIPGADHDTLVGEPLYWESIRAFLRQVAETGPASTPISR